jgi:hypothetical protein
VPKNEGENLTLILIRKQQIVISLQKKAENIQFKAPERGTGEVKVKREKLVLTNTHFIIPRPPDLKLRREEPLVSL